MKKKQKFTQIYFNEADSFMEIDTHNTNLKHRLKAFAERYPDLCQMTSDNGDGCMSFRIDKHRCSLRLTAPYPAERREAIRRIAKERGIHTKAVARLG